MKTAEVHSNLCGFILYDYELFACFFNSGKKRITICVKSIAMHPSFWYNTPWNKAHHIGRRLALNLQRAFALLIQGGDADGILLFNSISPDCSHRLHNKHKKITALSWENKRLFVISWANRLSWFALFQFYYNISFKNVKDLAKKSKSLTFII